MKSLFPGAEERLAKFESRATSAVKLAIRWRCSWTVRAATMLQTCGKQMRC